MYFMLSAKQKFHYVLKWRSHQNILKRVASIGTQNLKKTNRAGDHSVPKRQREESDRLTKSTSKDNSENFNPVNIQMLYEDLHQQLFGDGVERPIVEKMLLSNIVNHLKEHDLWGKPTSKLPPVPLTLPKLQGDLDTHFRHIAEQVSRPYHEQAERLASESLPEPPRQWATTPGWTHYSTQTGEATPVSFPMCPGLIFDVEVLMSEGQYPTMATAASPSAWYSWCSPRVYTADRHQAKVKLCDLIPMETTPDSHTPPGNQWSNRLVIGHNVSFDRSFIKEQYYIDGSRTKFLDTMSLHISVCGLTSTQRILYQALRKGKSGFDRKEIRERFRPDSLKSFQWTEESSMNNLQDVYQLYCPDQPVLAKETREVFIKGDMEDVKEHYQELMAYCAADVQATHAIFQHLWPEFQERLPHPVTFTGLLQMGTAYLPIRSSWQRYVSSADEVYKRNQDELRDTLMNLAQEAVKMWEGERYKSDIWLWDLDWTPRKVQVEELPVPTEENQQAELTKDGKKRRRPKAVKSPRYRTEAHPVWFADLLPKLAEKKEGMLEGPSKISTLRRCTPKLLRLTWQGFPLHHDSKLGWGYLKPEEGAVLSDGTDDVMDELERQEEALEEDKGGEIGEFPLREFLDYCTSLPQYEKQKRHRREEEELRHHVDRLEKELEESQEEEERIRLHRELKQIQRLAGRAKKMRARKSQSADGSHDLGIPGIRFFPLPHKDGPKQRVGSPLSKDFLSHIETGVLGSASGEHLNTIHTLSKLCSYWKSNMKRIHSQIDVELPQEALCETARRALKTVDDQFVGAIIPRLITAGTVTRRAVESTWLTASNAYPDRIGSEQKSMIQSPPGYCFVGADVDSQELWIAAVLGDSYFGGIHGCTALGWMTLQGNKTDGTDLHSKVAAILGISRDHAKVFNYGRIYGAAQTFAKQLLMQFNPKLSENEAQQRAKALYQSTKGKRLRAFDFDNADVDRSSGRWVGGSESAMFNKLESVIEEDEPSTPVLGCRISKALEPGKVNTNFLTSRINWVVQSSAVDYLHLMLVCMAWLCEKYDIQARFSISIHDEVRYLVKHEDRYRAALALQITNLLTRAMFAHRLGMNDLPQSVAFFSSVDLDTCLRKEVYLDCVTPSNPEGLQKGYNIQPGEALSIYEILEQTGGSLSTQQEDLVDIAMEFMDLG